MTVHTMMRNYGNYGDAAAHRKFGQAPLTMDELRAAAPSVFATEKHVSRSERYTYLPTVAVVEALGREGFRPYTVKQGKSRVPGKADYTKHLIRFRHDSLVDVRSGDSVLEIALRNSHDGTSAWEIMGAMWRVSCLNALVSGGELLIHEKIPHKGDQIHNVVEGSYRVLKESTRLQHVPEMWGQLRLNNDEARAFAAAAHQLRFDDGLDEETGFARVTATGQALEPVRLLTPNRDTDRGNDLWRVFNRVQENALKGGQEVTVRTAFTDEQGVKQYRTKQARTRPVGAIDDDIKLNRALWVLAEQMAKLKA